jgi:hypothetical protein
VIGLIGERRERGQDARLHAVPACFGVQRVCEPGGARFTGRRCAPRSSVDHVLPKVSEARSFCGNRSAALDERDGSCARSGEEPWLAVGEAEARGSHGVV